MNIIKYPIKEEWSSLVERPHLDTSALNATVSEVLNDVRQNGDEAVKKYELKFDNASLSSLAVSNEEIEQAYNSVDQELIDAITLAHSNIYKFHHSQLFHANKVETAPGVTCWQKSVAIEKVGLYIPGGTAPLFSTVLMLATPAKIAGCKEIVLCTPPDSQGNVSPGNQYVMAAKQQVSLHDVAIDMPAGPSEVCVVADDTCNEVFVAADLLSQAEHGIDSQVLLITTSEVFASKVEAEVEKQLARLPRKEIAAKALDNSKIVIVANNTEAMALANAYAPEHLILPSDNYEELAQMVVNAGSVFLGKYACESAGDYASGTNHTLPTHGYALAYNGVNLDSYNRKITFQHLTGQGVSSIGKAVVTMAENEQLEAHANAMRVRM